MDFLERHWGDLASLLGLAVTIWFAWRAKGAAEQARDAALQAKDRIATLDTFGDLGSAIEVLGEIMRLQRSGVWDSGIWSIVLDRYTVVRLLLTRSKGGARLAESEAGAIEAALQQFRIIMNEIEKAKTQELRERLKVTGFNTRIARQVERLESVRVAIRKAGA